DDDVPSGSIPMPSENSGLIHFVAPSSSSPKQNTLTPFISAVEDSNHVLEDADESIEAICSSGRICDDGSKTSKGDNSVEDGLNAEKCRQVLEDLEFEDDANESIEARLSSDKSCQSETQTESYSYLSEIVEVKPLDRNGFEGTWDLL
ncbi:hypothetical protein L195_g024861, partial [Trifolium pratense]